MLLCMAVAIASKGDFKSTAPYGPRVCLDATLLRTTQKVRLELGGGSSFEMADKNVRRCVTLNVNPFSVPALIVRFIHCMSLPINVH